ncbi:MAG: OB-fold nucleic acid binding domain-containing protein [Candidatus Nanoarchaeia archaeon]|nr:OB-fold nucleic acid binding domain-containing protein [Candidatus Nanoarchaeia archaeon]
MNEKHLFKLAIICSLIGLAGVVAASLMIEPDISSIASLSGMKEGAYVKITGSVINIRQTEKAAFLDVGDETGQIIIVAFADNSGFVKKDALPPFLDKGSNVSVEGKISSYNGKTEILADLIAKQ